MIAANPAPDRITDTLRFYALLARIKESTGGYRFLATCDGRMDWPRRGVYFFFEDGEGRSEPACSFRVVRIGTHALKPGSRTSLWDRLSQHRGGFRSGTGNHPRFDISAHRRRSLGSARRCPIAVELGSWSGRKRSSSKARRRSRDTKGRRSQSRTARQLVHRPYAIPVAQCRRLTGSGQPAGRDRAKRYRIA